MKTPTRLDSCDSKIRAARHKVDHCWKSMMKTKDLKMQTRRLKERSKAVDELNAATWNLTRGVRRNILIPNNIH
jgi:hypothetical protein